MTSSSTEGNGNVLKTILKLNNFDDDSCQVRLNFGHHKFAQRFFVWKVLPPKLLFPITEFSLSKVPKLFISDLEIHNKGHSDW